jgi:ascorbate-specific PTS system EIIC-type component UlaA
MPSSSSRSRVPVRRSPRPAPRGANAVPAPRARPAAVPFAVAFGFLLTAEVLYLGWLVWEPEPAFDRFVVIPLVLALAAAAGSVLVLLGRRGGWAVLAVAAVLALLVMAGLVLLLGALGGGGTMWAASLLLVGPLVTLVLALRRPVREWCGAGSARRSPGGRRRAGSAH